HVDRPQRQHDDVDDGAGRAARQLRLVRPDRHQRRQHGASNVAAAGAHALPPYGGRLETRRPRAPARRAAVDAEPGTAGDKGSVMAATPASVALDSAQPVPERGLIERLLSPVADVRRGEATSALLMTGAMFLLLSGYYLLKTAREGFILSEGGAEVKSYSSAGQALLLLVLVPAYGSLASRVNRVALIQWVTLLFAGMPGLFLLALGSGLHIGIVYFLWVGIFN